MTEYILDELRQAVRQREQLEKDIALMVAAARVEGHSWEKIAKAIGVTRPAAWERYGKGSSKE